jgi:putative transposase
LEAVFLTINGERPARWRAVEQHGNGLDMRGQRRRNQQAAKPFWRKLLKGLTYVPRVSITEQLKSDGAAQRESRPGGEPRQHRYRQHRCEPSPQPTRQRERRMQGCQAPGPAQRCLAA